MNKFEQVSGGYRSATETGTPVFICGEHGNWSTYVRSPLGTFSLRADTLSDMRKRLMVSEIIRALRAVPVPPPLLDSGVRRSACSPSPTYYLSHDEAYDVALFIKTTHPDTQTVRCVAREGGRLVVWVERLGVSTKLETPFEVVEAGFKTRVRRV